jgi:hypothetical protein
MPRTAAPANEDDRAKFVRLATNRVNTAIRKIRLIGNLSNRSNYSYTDKDVAKIFKALRAQLDECQAKFSSNGAAKDGGAFHLD